MPWTMWYQLVDAETRQAFCGIDVASVSSDGVHDVEDLRNKIHAKYDETKPYGK